MKKFMASILAVSLAASSAYAGGPVIIEEVVEEQPNSSVGILPIILVGIVLCAVLCGGDDDRQTSG